MREVRRKHLFLCSLHCSLPMSLFCVLYPNTHLYFLEWQMSLCCSLPSAVQKGLYCPVAWDWDCTEATAILTLVQFKLRLPILNEGQLINLSLSLLLTQLQR